MAFWYLLGAVLLSSIVTIGMYLRLRRARQSFAARETSLTADITRLKRVATRNETILEHAMDGFFVLDDQGRFVDVNPAFCRMLGYDRSTLLSMKITDVENSGGLLRSTGLRTGLHSFPSTHRHRDGHLVQLESSVVVLRDHERKVLVGFARDVTSRIHAEMALRKSEEQYRNVVETSRDLIWVVDRAGHWQFLNAAANDIYGVEPELMIGRPFLESVAPEDVNEMRRKWIEIKNAPRLHWRFDSRHVRKDGTVVALTFHAIAARDANGSLKELVGTARDVTKQRLFEAELREANERFEAIKEGIPLAYVIWTLDGKIRDWNRAAADIFGYPQNEALEQSVSEIILDKSDAEAFEKITTELERGARHVTSMISNRRKDGAVITCEWFNTVLRDADERPTFIASIIRD
ncbi:MAG: PAS domain S-box protein, partial [Phycisphaerae bacterium]